YLLFLMFFILFGILAGALSLALSFYMTSGRGYFSLIFIGFFILFGTLMIIFSIISYFGSDKIVTAVSHAKLAPKEQFSKLHNIVEEMCIASGLPKPRIYVIQDTAINAFAAGRNPQHAIVCVTTGCLTRLTRDQLQGVIAHELSHIRNFDVRTMTIAAVLVGMAVLISDMLFRMFIYGSFRGGNSKNGGIEVAIAIGVAIVAVVLTPIIAKLITMSISRKREFVADASAIEMTRNPDGLASALEVIGKDTEPLEAANKATAHLYIANPLKGQKLIMKSMFSTHPPIGERIRAIRGR
ncbi:MAG: M48 family metallopeptidase, partial [Candidatus Diapherotrites archaeon]|nr:M48 family metallopeptidase [Candidatus Diapherotrites archaeon]